MTKDDRIAFSLKIVSTDAEIKGIDAAQQSIQVKQSELQKLDTANKNLFDPTNVLVNGYQAELATLNGVVRSTIVEQDILDSANKTLQNHFFPNDINVTVPSLVPFHNVWPRTQPFGLTYGIGKNYVEVYPGSTAKEDDLIQPVLTLIASASANLDIENTSGQHVVGTGTCSNPSYTTQASCLLNGGTWTPGSDIIDTYAAVVTLKSNLVTAVNNLKNFLLAEVALIPVDPAQATDNNAARNNINNVIIPALNAWLANPDFNPVPGFVTAAQFPTYDPALLAPTKLYSGELTTLTNALNARSSFVTTRTSQVLAVLGSITQDVNTGDVTASSGLYGRRHAFLGLRISALGGSLTQIAGLNTAVNAQDSIKVQLRAQKTMYLSILPTSKLKANASGGNSIHVVDPGLFSPGDVIYVYADNQEELVRGIKTIVGDLITLSDTVPAKYTTSAHGRVYKDLT